jgi:carbon-monoxide dehydrogenase medium subunit
MLDYREPDSVGAALALLGEGEDARCLAGGQTLVAMMNANLVAPQRLVALRRIAELAQIGWEKGGALRIGAMATHATVAADPEIRKRQPLIAQAAAAIAHPAIRNFGTIGGAVAHGDPNADYPAALVAADAEIEIAERGGARRRIAAEDFFLDFLATPLESGQLVTAVLLSAPPKNARARYLKYARVDGDYATVSVAALVASEGGRCDHVAVALGACGPRPVRMREMELACIGRPLDARAIDSLAEALAGAADPVDDVRGSARYRRGLIPGLVRRALVEASS